MPATTPVRPDLPLALIVVKTPHTFAELIDALGSTGTSASFIGRAQGLRHREQGGSLSDGSLIVLCRLNGTVLGSVLWAGTGPGLGDQSKTYFVGCHPATARPAQPTESTGGIDLTGCNIATPLLCGPGLRRKDVNGQLTENEHKAYEQRRRQLWQQALASCGYPYEALFPKATEVHPNAAFPPSTAIAPETKPEPTPADPPSTAIAPETKPEPTPAETSEQPLNPAPSVTKEPARLTYEEFAQRVWDVLKQGGGYIGSNNGERWTSEQLASLAEAYPEHQARLYAASKSVSARTGAPLTVPTEVSTESAPAIETKATSLNFIGSAEDVLPPTGAKSRFRANVTAIELLAQLETEDRKATPEEQAILTRFSGWGALPQAFTDEDDDRSEWAQERGLLRGLMTRGEWEDARESTPFAHYTDPESILGMWAMAQRAGFQGGRVLESTAGIGRILALMPRELAGASSLVGFEKDALSGRILQQLFPKGDMQVAPFQDCTYPNGYFDLAITNVPFADVTITSDDRYRALRPLLHDYCLLRSMDLVRPGGLGIFLTSTGTLDKASPRVREELYRHSDLIAAFRLPGGSQGSAGTVVVCDLLVLRRRVAGEAKGSDLWLPSDVWPGDPQVRINRYFQRFPDRVLGTLDTGTGMYARKNVLVERTPDFPARWQAAIAAIPAGTMGARPEVDTDVSRLARLHGAPSSEQRRVGQLVIANGKLWQSAGGEVPMEPIEPVLTGDPSLDRRRTQAFAKQMAIVADYLVLRDVTLALLDAQLHETASESLGLMRDRLGKVYDGFVDTHGPLHKRTVVSAIESDPDASIVLALEQWDGTVATKSTIFTENTTNPLARAIIGSADASSALAIVLNTRGFIDLEQVGEAMGCTGEEAGQRLISDGLAFRDPVAGWVPADEYLSGDIRAKLAAVEQAAKIFAIYEHNIAALQKVLPAPLSYDEIYVTLGSTWIDPQYLREFSAHLLGGKPEQFTIDYNDRIGEWVVDYSSAGRSLAYSDQALSVWGIPGASFIDLLEAGVLRRPLLVYESSSFGSDDTANRTVDREATEAAANKIQEIEERFRDWLWEGPERRNLLVQRYNDLFNAIVPRTYNGDHLTFPGMAKPGRFANGTMFHGLRDVQRNGVWQIITRGNALIGHEVGVGKSMTMIAAAMELRRLGLARKPAIAVLKSTCVDFEAETRRLYPAARILSASGDFDAHSRRETIARIATGDWDLVLLTHDQLQRIPMSPATQITYLTEEMVQYEDLLRGAGYENPDAIGKKSARQVKQIAKARLRLKERIADAMRAAADETTASFEQTGIDFLFVDEAHKFKALPIKTRMGDVKGIPIGDSQRAMNMHMIATYLRDKNQGRGLVFATGTPVVNTLCEVFIMQTYIQPHELRARKVHHFDAWAANFGEATTRMEFTHSGEYKPVVRFTQFVNLPELHRLSFQDFSIVRAAAVGAIVRPHRTDIPVEIEPSAAQLTYMRALQFRAKRLEAEGREMDLRKDNHLLLATDGRLCSTDVRLSARPGGCAVPFMENETPDERAAIEQAYTVAYDYQEGDGAKAAILTGKVTEVLAAHPGTTQLIFTETNESGRTGFSLLNEILDRLQNAGIPRERIEIFHDLSDAQRYRAAQRLNAGEAWVGIGNTATLGTGVNCQRLLKAVHHIDAPWTPAAMEQRNGRIWRQGNTNPEITVYTYITKRTLDAWLYQTLGRKDRFIRAFLDGSSSERTVSDQDVESMSYDQLMAIASGNPLLYERINTVAEVDRMVRAKQRHAMTEMQNRNLLERQIGVLRELRQKVVDLDADAAFYAEHRDLDTAFVREDGSVVEDREMAATELRRDIMRAGRSPAPIGRYRGFGIFAYSTRMAYNSSFIVYLQRGADTRKYQLDVGHGDNLMDLGMETLQVAGRTLGALAWDQRRALREVDQLEVSIAKVRGELGRPFRLAADLSRKQLMLTQIDGALAAGRTALTDQEIAQLRAVTD